MIDDIYQKPDLRTFDQIMVDISTISNKCRLIVMTVILVLCHSLLSSDLQGGLGGWPTGYGKKLSSCQAQLGQATCLAVA